MPPPSHIPRRLRHIRRVKTVSIEQTADRRILRIQNGNE
jgi:hypothetical protein